MRPALLRTALVLGVAAGLANAQILQDFHFDDPPERTLTQTQNSVPGGGSWSEDIGGTFTTGDGVLRIQRPVGTPLHSYIDIETITEGSYRMVVDIAGWNFSTMEGAFFTERIEFGFLNTDTGQFTAMGRFGRTNAQDPHEFQLSGVAAGTDASGIAGQILPVGATQSEPVALAVDYHATGNSYEVFYKIGSSSTDDTPWQSIGTGPTSPERVGNFIRLSAINNFFDDPDEFFDIDRIYMMRLADEPPLLPGDANRDGRVDGEDFLIWQAAFGVQSGATWDDGDFNGDGRVDGEDFLIWQAHFGSVAESSAVTPEPAAVALLAMAAAALIARRRRA